MRLFLLSLWALAAVCVAEEKTNNHSHCLDWAALGECEKNPGWMLENCAKACATVANHILRMSKELQEIDSFFDLSANDLHGNKIDFSTFRGDVTVIVNVASYCGYTDSHYRGMVELWNDYLKPMQDSGKKVRLLAFPCNQFGEQEPGSAEDIEYFVTRNYGVEFTMMEKVDVNGLNASLVYKFLKREAGPDHIGWNFATYYVVAPDGTVASYSGVEPMDLKDAILDLANAEL